MSNVLPIRNRKTATTSTMQIKNIADICFRKGVQHAIISPGSRSAPITVFFSRHPGIQTHVVKDERCAAYIALGIAQQTRTTAVLICTSGTAALNFGPGVAEAFYQQVPLLVLTADRPPEWIDQQDGQAVHQNRLYTDHCKGNYTLPLDTDIPASSWHFDRIISQAINLAERECMGPVHINVPIREPFYDALTAEPADSAAEKEVKIIEEGKHYQDLPNSVWEQLAKRLQQASKPMLLVGQNRFSTDLIQKIERFMQHTDCALLGDVLSNLHTCKQAIQNVDTILPFLEGRERDKLIPDLLITFGQSILSKNIKNIFRQGKIREHWHIQPAGEAADTFQSLTQIIRTEPALFLEKLVDYLEKPGQPNVLADKLASQWALLASRSDQVNKKFFLTEKTFGEFHAVQLLLQSLPSQCVLHLGNSMSVRYAGLAGINQTTAEVYSNRGTAGIDGCLSTAVGHALAGDQPHVILLGDVSFFYDRNSLWLNNVPANLRIVVLNNQGGGIFSLIEGPRKLPELQEFFTTDHTLEAGSTAKEMGLEYFYCPDRDSLLQSLEAFTREDGPAKILEVKTSLEENTAIFTKYRASFGAAGKENK